MSGRPSFKDQYGLPLDAQNIGSRRPSMTPPTSPTIQKIEKPTTLAQVIQNSPRPQNPLIPVQNRYTPHHYHNTLITPTDL